MPFETALNRMKYYGSLLAVMDKFPVADKDYDEALSRLKHIKKESRERWIEILNRRK
jgi:hypothetical protein